MTDEFRRRRGKLLRWTEAGGWAVLDRGLFSLANFLVSLLLARWLTPAEYGSFALAMAAFLFAGTLHEGWVTEPLLVYGPTRYRDTFQAYLGFVIRRHVRFGLGTVIVGAGLAALAAVLGRREVAGVLAATALVTPWILLQWMARLACYASVGTRRAAMAGLVQLVIVVVGLYGLQAADRLSTVTALFLLGIAGGLTGIALLATLRPTFGDGTDLDEQVGEVHQRYGSWAAATGLLTWIPGQVYYVALPALGAAAAGGGLRAVMNLALPLMQVYVAAALVLTTMLARARTQSEAKFNRLVRGSALFVATGSLIYLALLTWLGPSVMHWLYAGRYDDLAGLLPVVGLIPVVGLGATVLAPALRALEKPDLIFVAYAASTVVSLSLGLWLTVRHGAVGSALAIVATTIVTTVVLAWLFVGRSFDDAGYGSASMSTTAKSGPEYTS